MKKIRLKSRVKKIISKKNSFKRVKDKNFIVLSNAAVEVGQKDEDKIEERG